VYAYVEDSPGAPIWVGLSDVPAANLNADKAALIRQKIIEEFAKAVAAYCQSDTKPFVIQLDAAPEPPTAKGPIFPSTRAAPHVAQLRRIYQVSTSTSAKPPDKQ